MGTERAATTDARAGERPLTGAEHAVLALFPLAKLVVHLATLGGYGIFRDELYYFASTAHLAAGYVDHPPLSILILAAVQALFGDSLAVARTVPAVAGAATVLLVGLTARTLGGRAPAQAVAMAAALAAPVYLALDHFYSMSALDLLIWAAAAWLLARILRPAEAGPGGVREPRSASPWPPTGRLGWWIVLGVVLGLGLENKLSVLWLGAGIALGLVLSRARRLLGTPGPWVAGGIALLLLVPHLLWQVAHDWPTLEFMANARTVKMTATAPWELLAEQVLMIGPLAFPLWAAGLVFFLFLRAGRPWRLLGWAWIGVFLLLALSGSARASYLAASFTWLLAGGGVAFERGLARLGRPRLARSIGIASAGALVGGGALLAPMALPILPVERFVAYQERLGLEPRTDERQELAELPQFFADMHGWERIVDALEAAYLSLPEDERARARIYADNYGVAGAVDVLGRRRGLPPALSGHNAYWMWGAEELAAGLEVDVLVVHGADREELEQLFTQVERAGTVACGRCMPYEDGEPVWIVRGPRVEASTLWAATKKFV